METSKLPVLRLALAAAMCVGGAAIAAPLPAGWTCLNVNGEQCGRIGADGDIPLSPLGGALFGGQHGFVVSTGADVGKDHGLGLGGETSGGVARSPTFTAGVGDQLVYHFNFITTDAWFFSDYAWVRLLDGALDPVAMLFTARVQSDPSTGDTVPGMGLPAIGSGVSLTPATADVTPGATVWSPLPDSGVCYGTGCGNTGWIQMLYTFSTAGDYILEFGVSNWSDDGYNSGLAFDGRLNRASPPPPHPSPEPTTLALLGLGLAGLGLMRRRA